MPAQSQTEEMQPLLRESDEHVMLRLRASDKSALDLLFSRYSRLVWTIGYRILRDRGEAEEVVQESFLYLFRKANLFDPAKGRARAWIIQVAVHRALNRRSYLAARRFYSCTHFDSWAEILCGETDLDREIGATVDRAQLRKALHELPDRQRRTVESFFFDGLELKEIGELYDEPIGNVRHHYYRGLERLRKNSLIRKLRIK